MRKQSFLIPVITGIVSALSMFLVGCSAATFSVAVSTSSDASDVEKISEPLTDGGIDTGDSTNFCETFSCKSGCPECGTGLGCGNGGAFICGSTNCTFDLKADASAFNCPTGMGLIFKCNHYEGQNSQDIVPRCLFREGTTADNDITYWCCPQ